MGLPADPFDEVFRTEGIDPLLILGRRHLERVLAEFAGHFNAEQRYRGLWLTRPFPSNVIEFLGQRREPEARPIGRDDSRVPPRSSVTEYLYPSVSPQKGAEPANLVQTSYAHLVRAV
jgi:hypothetical protein